MEISKIFGTLELHDSPVESIIYSSEKKLLELEIELCNYMQRGFRDGEPEMISGSLVFSNVEEFVSDPPLDGIEWSKDFSGEISTSGYIPQRDKAGLQSAELVIYCENYKTRTQTVLILGFLASDAKWHPLLGT